MATWFTSDLHIGHDREFIWQNRGFKSQADHDSYILDYWARTVSPDDFVVLVGDFVMGKGKIDRAWDIINKMPFRHLSWILGNHDHPIAKMQAHWDVSPRRDDVDIAEMGQKLIDKGDDGKLYILNHFPPEMNGDHVEDRYKDYSVYAPTRDWGDGFIHGHTHSKVAYSEFHGKPCYHVGWDAHNGFVQLPFIDYVW